MVIARNRALAVHHVTVHRLRDKLAVSLDLEVDGKLSLDEFPSLFKRFDMKVLTKNLRDAKVVKYPSP